MYPMPPGIERGKNYFIRTEISNYVGRLESMDERWIILSDTAIVTAPGRLQIFLKDSRAIEYESCFSPVYIPTRNVIDLQEFKHPVLKVKG